MRKIHSVSDYLAQKGRNPTIKLRVRCPLCSMVVYPKHFSKSYDGQLEVFAHAYLGRAMIQQLPSNITDEMRSSMEVLIAEKCVLILKGLGHRDTIPFMMFEIEQLLSGVSVDSSSAFSEDITPKVVQWIE